MTNVPADHPTRPSTIAVALAPQVTRREALLGGLCLCCLPALGRSDTVFATSEIARGIHVRRGVHEEATAANLGGIANIGFIVGRDAVAVSDPGGSLADGERLRAAIRAVTDRPIRYVVISHVHPDHVFGAGAFLPDEPVFIGHERLPGALAQRGEFYRGRLEEVLGKGKAGPIVTPTRLVHEHDEIDLGGRVLALTAHPAAHTQCDLSFLDRETDTLFPSDLLFVERAPSLDGSLRGWVKELAALKRLPAKRAVPGHGPTSVDWPSGCADLERYLDVLLRETRQAVKDKVSISAAVDQVGRSERSRWQLFDDYHGHNVTRAFKEFEWE
jgi:quinoprotein relay system zinc metallohydrolase 2